MRALAIVEYVLTWPPMPLMPLPQSLHFHLREVNAYGDKYVCGACAMRDSRYDDTRYSSGIFHRQSKMDEIPDKVQSWMFDHADEHIRIALWTVSLQVWTKYDANSQRKQK